MSIMANKSNHDFLELRHKAGLLLAGKAVDLKGLKAEDFSHLIHELQVHQIELRMQKEALEAAQQIIEASRIEYADLYDFAPIAYITLDSSGIIKKANLTAARLLGVERGRLLQRTLIPFICSDDRDTWFSHLKKVREGEGNQTCELKMIKEDATPLHAQIDSRPIVDLEGNASLVRTVIIDITNRKQAEDEILKQSHNLAERLKELNCLYSVSDLIQQPDITIEEILKGVTDLIPPAWQYPEFTGARIIVDGQEFKTNNFMDTNWKQSSSIIVDGESFGLLEVCYLKEMPSLDNGPFLEEERVLLNFIAKKLGRTIEKKHTEVLLRQVEAEKQAILDASTDLIIHIDSDMNIFWANEIAAAAINKNTADLIGNKCFKLFSGANDFCSGCVFRGALKTGKVANTILCRPGDNDPDKPYWECSMVPVRDENDQITGAIEIARNISTRKQAEEDRKRLIGKLQKALIAVRRLSGLLPICANCKKIRDDKGYWSQIESYIRDHSEASFTHSICPECKRKLYPGLQGKK